MIKVLLRNFYLKNFSLFFSSFLLRESFLTFEIWINEEKEEFPFICITSSKWEWSFSLPNLNHHLPSYLSKPSYMHIICICMSTVGGKQGGETRTRLSYGKGNWKNAGKRKEKWGKFLVQQNIAMNDVIKTTSDCLGSSKVTHGSIDTLAGWKVLLRITSKKVTLIKQKVQIYYKVRGKKNLHFSRPCIDVCIEIMLAFISTWNVFLSLHILSFYVSRAIRTFILYGVPVWKRSPMKFVERKYHVGRVHRILYQPRWKWKKKGAAAVVIVVLVQYCRRGPFYILCCNASL